MKLASVVGARPNFVKLAPLYKATQRIADKHVVIHTGQHYDYEMSELFFKEFELPRPDINLNVGSGSPGFQIGEMLKKLEEIFVENRFDLVIVYGDTNSTFAGALAANRLEIKTAHVEAGLRSFDKRMPEETNRIMTDSLCDFLFAPTWTSVMNLRREQPSGKIFQTGDISVEVVDEATKKSEQLSSVLDKLEVSPKSYYLFTMHRAENTSSIENLSAIIKTFELLSDETIVFPVHPRTRKVLSQCGLAPRLERLQNVKILQPVGYLDFIKLLRNAKKAITDSGGVQKEAYLLHVPCITIRRNTEWVETVEAGWNILTDTNTESIVNACKNWMPNKPLKKIFGDGNTAQKIANLIATGILGPSVLA